jgi:glycosyltransferase involved in cell wall biosynthesis
MNMPVDVAKYSFKRVAKKVLPFALRSWIRNQQEGLRIKVQDAKDRIYIRRRHFRNLEGILNYNVTLSATHKRPGVSALLRIKNEETKIYYCLRSIYDLFREIVIVDNGSTDKTLQIICDFRKREDMENKIKIYFYPFKIAPYGKQHVNTPEHSVHNFTYYSNWALSQCSHKYVCKWDGDMVLRNEARESFRGFLERIQKDRKTCWIIYGQTVYRDLAGNYYLAEGELNGEIRIFPNGFNPRFYKVDLYEMLRSEPPLPERQFRDVTFYELKFTDEDEFCHLGTFDFPTERKRRETKNFQLIKGGKVPENGFQKLPRSFLEDQGTNGFTKSMEKHNIN